MFGFFKKKELQILSPMNGKAIPITEIEDDAFSEKMLGDGVGIIPTDGMVVAPVDGEVIQIFDTLHAYGIRTNDGVEILIHIGLNTVELKGKGFKAFVKTGQKVKLGEKIAEVDIDLIKKEGYLVQTPIVITNMDIIKETKCNYGEVQAGKSVVISYNK